MLAQGQIARYDKDIGVNAYSVAKRAQVRRHSVEGEYVEPNTWEIFAPADIRLSEIQRRRFNILDRTQEKIRIATQIQEDTEFSSDDPALVGESFATDLFRRTAFAAGVD